MIPENEPSDIAHMQEMPEDQSLDFVPKQFSDYLGQQALKEKLSIYTQAAKLRNEPLDHMLLFGPPGLGKTTLARIMAEVMNVDIKLCTGPMLERSGDLVAILSSLHDRDILFVDEIHRMPTAVEEVLYSAMEQFRVDVIIGQGAGAKSVTLPIAPFTLIGATTKSGMLSGPLRSRFGISERIEFYTNTELAAIVKQSAHFLQLSIDDDAAVKIGSAARGTPRIAKKLLRRVRDVAQVQSVRTITHAIVTQTFNYLGIDCDGLGRIDNAILKTITIQFDGGPVALDTIAAIIGEDSETIETVYEPFLLRTGYLEKTARGRRIPHKVVPLLQKKYHGQQTVFTQREDEKG